MKKSEIVKLGEPISVNNRIVQNIIIAPAVLASLGKNENKVIDIVTNQYAHAQLAPTNEVNDITDDLYFYDVFSYWEGDIEIIFKIQIKGSLLEVLDARFV